MNSKNMNYIFNVEYFRGANHLKSMKTDRDSETYRYRNMEIRNFSFKSFDAAETWADIEGYKDFSLFTSYPGLLIGTGNPHSLAIENAIKCGFTFDYVTGIPYVTGSSLKGIIRSMFPEKEVDKEHRDKNAEKYKMIKYLAGKDGEDDSWVDALRDDIFENNDVFLGVYPFIRDGEQIMDLDYVTPHKEKMKNPVPINIIKVRPNVEMKFCYILHESSECNMSADEKLELFKKIIMISGIGAKTNVGFGAFREKRIEVSNLDEPAFMTSQSGSPAHNGGNNKPKNGPGKIKAGRCKDCGAETKENKNYPGTYYSYCFKCNEKRRKGR